MLLLKEFGTVMKKTKRCAAIILSLMTAAFSTNIASALTTVETSDMPTDTDAAEIMFGDVDGDNVTTSSDALQILRNSVGLQEFSEDQIKTADVDKDGNINSGDALTVLRVSISGSQSDADPSVAAAKAAADLAVKAVREGNIPDLVYHTTFIIPDHYAMAYLFQSGLLEAFFGQSIEDMDEIKSISVDKLDEIEIENIESDPEKGLEFFVRGAPLDLLFAFGKGGDTFEFTDGEAIEIDSKKLIDDLLKYSKDLPAYMVVKPSEDPNVSFNVDSESSQTVEFRGASAVLVPVDMSESGVQMDISEDFHPELEVGRAYRFKVSGTDKTIRVVYIDGQYRVIGEDLISIIRE